MNHHRTGFALIAAIWAFAAATACAQGQGVPPYPNRPVKIIAPQAPGGGVDLVGRIVADRLGRAMGQSFVIENLAGAGGSIATQTAARAPADGYTLMIGYVATHATNPAVRKVPYDPIKDFTPIAMIGGTPNVIVVRPSVPVQTLAEFVAYAQKIPTRSTTAPRARARSIIWRWNSSNTQRNSRVSRFPIAVSARRLPIWAGDRCRRSSPAFPPPCRMCAAERCGRLP